jgi:hypothetical protein
MYLYNMQMLLPIRRGLSFKRQDVFPETASSALSAKNNPAQILPMQPCHIHLPRATHALPVDKTSLWALSSNFAHAHSLLVIFHRSASTCVCACIGGVDVPV